jgi:cysteine synthase A
LFLKDERQNPTGSIKDRTAAALITSAAVGDRLATGPGLVESTSGNLGAALAWQASRAGVRFRAVVDPNLSPDLAEKITDLGAELDPVDQPDSSGNFLQSRLARVGELVKESGWVWTNQYGNPAAVEVHIRETGPELVAQLPAPVDELYVAVSTCGTLAGLGDFAHRHLPGTRVVAVDVEGSTVFGGPPTPRRITGIGSARLPDFDVTGCHDDVEIVSEDDAIQACHQLLAEVGLGVGASTGAVVAAFLRRASAAPTATRVVALIADGADNYRRTICDWSWLAERGFEVAGWRAPSGRPYASMRGSRRPYPPPGRREDPHRRRRTGAAQADRHRYRGP